MRLFPIDSTSWTKSIVFVALVLLISTAEEARAAIAITNTSTAKTTSADTSLSWTHTAGNTSQLNRVLIVGVSLVSTSGTGGVASVTWNGAPLTVIAGTASNPPSNPDIFGAVFFLATPLPGTGTIMVTASTASNIVAGALTLTGAIQSAPFGGNTATNNGNAPSLSSFSAAGTLNIDNLATRGTVNATITGGQTAQWNGKTGIPLTAVLGAGSTKFSTGGTTTLSYSLSPSTAFTYAYTLITPASGTAAEFASFDVKGYNEGQYLEWKTARETDNLGFNVYRDEAGKRTRLNSGLLAGSALTVGEGTTLGAGKSYVWWDAAPAGKHTQYWLEEIDLKGESVWHGPVSVDKTGGAPPGSYRAALLSRLGNADLQADMTRAVERRVALPITPGRFALPSGFSSQHAAKISVKQEGFYRVTQAEIAAAGVQLNGDLQMLQLYVDGQEQPIKVILDQQGAMSAIEFYGVGADGAFTDARVYWLVAGTQPGLRIQQKPAGRGALVVGSFAYTVERRDRSIYFSSLLNGDKENFFGAVIARNPVTQAINLQHVRATSKNATLEVALQGVTHLPHRVAVVLNGTSLGEVDFNGQDTGVLTVAVPQSLLAEGQNIVTLAAQNGDGDISLVDYIRVTYQHSLMADNNALRLTAKGGKKVSIDGFSNSSVRVFDVTNPTAVQELIGSITKSAPGYAVTVKPKGTGPRRLLALAEDQIKPAANVAANEPSSWRQTSRGADLLIITREDFARSVAPLAALRTSQGFFVSVVNIEDVYDEFSYGQKSPQALKDFLAYAKTSWNRPPQFVLLVGDASYDRKNYLGMGTFDFVPSMLIDTVYMETASDDWFVDFNEDYLPDLAIGRLPVRTAQEATAMITKIVGYDMSHPSDESLLVADSADDFNFGDASVQLRPLIQSVRLSEIDRGQMSDAAAKGQLIDAVNRGQKIVNYYGHGNLDQWRGNLLTTGDASSFTNDHHLSLFVMMTCLTGYFQDASVESLAEALLKADRGGAVAVWASSGMCDPGGQVLLGQQFYRLLFNKGSDDDRTLTLGEAAMKAKSALGDSDIRRTWILFGDPTMRLK